MNIWSPFTCYSSMMFCCFDQVCTHLSYTLQVQVNSKDCVEQYHRFYLKHLHMKYKQL